jgi:sulfatase maturation enzyme AslB (radical SAM superfamily)
MDMIAEALDQYQTMHRRHAGTVCLNHYNEPLLDPRILDIADLAKSHGSFFVYFITNGDLLTPEIAKCLDGLLDCLVVSLYGGDSSVAMRVHDIGKLFTKTSLNFAGEHCATHFSNGNHGRRVACTPNRLIINHRGQYLACCEDMVGQFGMGTFPETSLEDYWYGAKHAKMLSEISVHPYCTSCPRRHP